MPHFETWDPPNYSVALGFKAGAGTDILEIIGEDFDANRCTQPTTIAAGGADIFNEPHRRLLQLTGETHGVSASEYYTKRKYNEDLLEQRLLDDICLIKDESGSPALVFHSVGFPLCDYQTTELSMTIEVYTNEDILDGAGTVSNCDINYPLRTKEIYLNANLAIDEMRSIQNRRRLSQIAADTDAVKANVIYDNQISVVPATNCGDLAETLINGNSQLEVLILTLKELMEKLRNLK